MHEAGREERAGRGRGRGRGEKEIILHAPLFSFSCFTRSAIRANFPCARGGERERIKWAGDKDERREERGGGGGKKTRQSLDRVYIEWLARKRLH